MLPKCVRLSVRCCVQLLRILLSSCLRSYGMVCLPSRGPTFLYCLSPVVFLHIGCCVCLSGFPSFPFLSFCLLLSPLVFSCFPSIFLVRRVTMGRTLLGKLYGVSGGIIASTLLIFVKVFPLPAKSGAFSHSTGRTSAPPSLVASSMQEPNTPGSSAKGFWEPDSWAPTRFRKSVPEPRLGSFGCVVPTSGLAFLHIVVPEKIEKYRKASKPLQHAF